MARATALRNEVKSRFYPYAESLGFVRDKATSAGVTFRRNSGEIIHVFDIQWDKYGAPRFVINFAEGPLAGLSVGGERGYVQGADLQTYDCGNGGRLQRRRGPYLRCWFQQRKPLLEALRTLQWNYGPDDVVDQLIG